MTSKELWWMHFSRIRPGDHVTVRWPSKMGSPWDGYPLQGVVTQVTEHFVAIMSSKGYGFCVGISHVATGAKVTRLRQEVRHRDGIHTLGRRGLLRSVGG